VLPRATHHQHGLIRPPGEERVPSAFSSPGRRKPPPEELDVFVLACSIDIRDAALLIEELLDDLRLGDQRLLALVRPELRLNDLQVDRQLLGEPL
jgi:hypothetical protein